MNEVANHTDFQKEIVRFEDKMKQVPGATCGDSPKCPLIHTFVDGAYVREIFMPKGMLISSKIHKVTHPYFILKGECSVLTEEGVRRIKAPFYGVTKAGTKRVLYIHEDCTWVTVHVTKEQDLEKIEDEIIAPTFDKVPNAPIDVKLESVELVEFMKEVKKGDTI